MLALLPAARYDNLLTLLLYYFYAVVMLVDSLC